MCEIPTSNSTTKQPLNKHQISNFLGKVKVTEVIFNCAKSAKTAGVIVNRKGHEHDKKARLLALKWYNLPPSSFQEWWGVQATNVRGEKVQHKKALRTQGSEQHSDRTATQSLEGA